MAIAFKKYFKRAAEVKTLLSPTGSLFRAIIQTSQLSRFGRETHDFLTDLTTAYQSHDFSQFNRNIIIIIIMCLIRSKVT